jgi:hypothetical protein
LKLPTKLAIGAIGLLALGGLLLGRFGHPKSPVVPAQGVAAHDEPEVPPPSPASPPVNFEAGFKQPRHWESCTGTDPTSQARALEMVLKSPQDLDAFSGLTLEMAECAARLRAGNPRHDWS